MNLEIIPVGWFAIIVGILVVVASGAFLVIWKIKAAEYPSFKSYKEAQLKLPATEASLSVKESELESIRNEFATLSVQNAENKKEKEKYDDWERQIKESFAELDSQELSIKEMQERKKKAVDDLLEKEKLLNQTNVEIEEGAKKIEEQTETLKKLEKNQKELKKENKRDYSDMINDATAWLIDNKYQTNLKWIIVDEFQDISAGRFRFLQQLLAQNPNTKLIVVGDDWQSIYRFAGSDINFINKFEKFFGKAVEFPLTKSFRFNDHIKELSQRFIQKPKGLHKSKSIDVDNVVSHHKFFLKYCQLFFLKLLKIVYLFF